MNSDRDWWPSEDGLKWTYENQVILAPMVRIGTLPMRLLARFYGATMVYSEEIIDKKVINAQRVVNERAGTVDFYSKSSKIPFFKTVPGEKIVFQVGTSNSNLALQAANEVAGDVKAFDVNMGCPKHFSIHCGMGAALLSEPEKVRDILSTLRRNLNIPVTCKIRLLETSEKTLELLKIVQACGADAVAVHARQKPDRPNLQAMIEGVRDVVEHANIPVIHNADVFYDRDIEMMKKETGAQGIMIARGAQWNPSIFRKQGMLPVYDVMKQYLEIACSVENYFPNTKFCMIQMLRGPVCKGSLQRKLCQTRNYEQIHEFMQLLELDESVHEEYNAHVSLLPRSVESPCTYFSTI